MRRCCQGHRDRLLLVTQLSTQSPLTSPCSSSAGAINMELHVNSQVRARSVRRNNRKGDQFEHNTWVVVRGWVGGGVW